MLTAERLRELLHYDLETGVFRWRRTRRGNVRAGQIAGRTHVSGYRYIIVDGRDYLAHRLAWFYVYGRWPRHQIDHKNLVKADNRIDNLREATSSQNNANCQVKKNKSGFRGVSFHRGNWVAQVGQAGRLYREAFSTPEAAYAAYCEAARKHYGEFARVA